MANPSGSNNDGAQQSQHGHGASSSFNGNSSVPDYHNPGISSDWTPDEQSLLEEGLSQYASESNIIRYAKIAVQLQNKTVRDVAMRCRWMTKKDISKRRKEDHSLTRKGKDRKEILTDPLASSSNLAAQSGFSPYAQGMVTNGKANGILHSEFGDATGNLLQQNAQALQQISANLEKHQAHENIRLFAQARENLHKILSNLGDAPDKMKHMPPFPVKLNEELLGTILPQSIRPNQ